MATGALWHYFADLDEVLAEAFKFVFERTSSRIAHDVGDATGLTALMRMMEQIHPLDKTTNDEALVVVNSWDRVTAHRHQGVREAFAERQWQDEYRAHLDQAVAAGELHQGTPTVSLANALLVLALGHQVTYVLEAPLAQADLQWDTIRMLIEPWLTNLGRERIGWALIGLVA